MKITTVQLTIPSHAKVFVHKDQRLAPGTNIAQYNLESFLKTIPAADMLKIKPQSITKYLRKGIGEHIEAGQVLIEKKGLLSSLVVKSPYTGKIDEVDLKKGTLVIASQESGNDNILITPFAAKVKDIQKNIITLEIEAILFEAENGAGEQSIGDLYIFSTDKLNVLEIHDEVEGTIVACKSISHDAAAKLDALECRGIIFSEQLEEAPLPWIQVKEPVLKNMLSYHQKKAWMLPTDKKIYVQA